MVLSAFCKSSFSLFAFYKKIYIKTMNDKKIIIFVQCYGKNIQKLH